MSILLEKDLDVRNLFVSCGGGSLALVSKSVFTTPCEPFTGHRSLARELGNLFQLITTVQNSAYVTLRLSHASAANLAIQILCPQAKDS